MQLKSTLKKHLLLAAIITFSPCLLLAQVFDFKNPLPIPDSISGPYFEISVQGAFHNFDPNGAVSNINLNVPIATYCYNKPNGKMSYLGPTLYFEKSKLHTFNISNMLPDSAKTTVHWHGLNIPAKQDGGPHQVINNGSSWNPNFNVIDPVQTAWYHTHLMDLTTDQVIRGLSGMIVVHDKNDPLTNSQVPRDYGINGNDFPIIIQEKDFILDSSTNPPTAIKMKAGEKPGNGPYTIVNGVVGGCLRVAPEMVRLRVLNGSPRKMFNIGLSTELDNPTNFADMHMIATGGGYLKNPVTVKNSVMSIGDRREFMIDFSQWANGDTVYVINLPPPYDANYGITAGRAIMAFVVWDPIFPPNPVVTLPTTLDANYDRAPGLVFKERTKRLMIDTISQNGHGGPWTIDGTGMDMHVINDTVLVNTKESWTIINTTPVSHPFHIHKVQFQVVEYTGTLAMNDSIKTYTYPNLPAELIGYKDVQLIRGGATMTFEARFDSFPSPLKPNEGYMYHCHILTHEDTSMMHQFVVVDSVDFFASLLNLPRTEILTVYPNPANNTVSFKGTFNEPGTLRIYSPMGKLLRQEEITSLEASTVLVGDIPKGIVIFEYTAENKRYISKVILQ